MQVYYVVNKGPRVNGVVESMVLGHPTESLNYTLLWEDVVGPILQYCTPVWSPYLMNIPAFESVQRGPMSVKIYLNRKQGEMTYPNNC